MHVYFYAPDRTEARLASAKTAIDRALGLQPDLGEGHYALALYYYWGHRDYARAIEELHLARQSIANSADVPRMLAAIARRQGRAADMIAGFQEATLLDPRSSSAIDQLGLGYAALRRYAEADRAFAQAEEVTRDPADERVTRALSRCCGRATWRRCVPRSGHSNPAATPMPATRPAISILYWWSHDFANALRIAQNNSDDEWSDTANIALPRLLYVAWAQQATNDPKAAETYAAVRKTATAAVAQQDERADPHLTLALRRRRSR